VTSVEERHDLTHELLLELRSEFRAFREEMHAFREEMNAFRAETRVELTHLTAAVADLRHDVRRIDGRVDQLFLVQAATLATIVAALVTVLVTQLAN
jgi:hypothetical protein